VEYPIDKNMGLFSALAFSKASSPQGYQFTGLSLCCKRYGDFSLANLFKISAPFPIYYIYFTHGNYLYSKKQKTDRLSHQL
jgi:hypothetical protein